MNLVTTFIKGLGNVSFASKSLLNNTKCDLGRDLKENGSKLKNGQGTIKFKFNPDSRRVSMLARIQSPKVEKLEENEVDGETLGCFVYEGQSLVFNDIDELVSFLVEKGLIAKGNLSNEYAVSLATLKPVTIFDKEFND